MYNSLEIFEILKWMKIYIFMIYSWFIEIDSNWFVNIFDIYVCMDLYWLVLKLFVKILKNIIMYDKVCCKV